jgi:16S rRNA processing protein RimM
VVPTDAKAAGAEPVLLGRVTGVYGVKGWVRLFSHTEPREAILEYRDCLLRRADSWEAARIVEGRRHGKSVVARFDGVADRDAAAGLTGADIAVDRDALPQLEANEYYWTDLEGMEVRHRDGSSLGTVAYMMATGANDVMVVQGGNGADREILVPFVPERVVLDVDLAAGVIEVDWEWD